MDAEEPKLGTMQKVELREVWRNEAADLTPWLASNLELLSDSLGLGDDLEVKGTEKRVGSYRADLVCEGIGGTVVVENQLGVSDHDHLGKLITYGAGVKAQTVVWIAGRFRDEHRAALDWLNATSEDTDFFGVELELWRIDNSRSAPRLNLVAKPNDWSREVVRTPELSPMKEVQLRYWRAFREVLLSAKGPARPQKPRSDSYSVVAIGRSGFHLAAGTNSQAAWIRAELYFHHAVLKKQAPALDANAYFASLKRDCDAIERQLDFELEWEALPKAGSCRVAVYRKCDPTDESDWPKQHEWLADRLNRMHHVLAPRIKVLKPLDDSDADSTNPNPPSN